MLAISSIRVWCLAYVGHEFTPSDRQTDRRILEAFLGMSFGYVLDFQTTLSVNLCLRTPGWKYTLSATPTKARQRQRSSVRFWKLESDHIVGKLLLALIDYGVLSIPNRHQTRKRQRTDADRFRRNILNLVLLFTGNKSRSRVARPTNTAQQQPLECLIDQLVVVEPKLILRKAFVSSKRILAVYVYIYAPASM